MSRRCSVCNLQEHAVQIAARIRAGEPLAALAKEFEVSVDSMARHARNHVLRSAKPASGDLISRLENLIGRVEEMFSNASAAGDTRAGLDALGQLIRLTESLIELEKEKAEREQKEQHAQTGPGLLSVEFLDQCVSAADEYEAGRKRACAEGRCPYRAESVTRGQVSDSGSLIN